MDNEPSDNPGHDGIQTLWEEYVKDELKSLNVKVDKIRDKMEQISIDIGMLKVKASLWGGAIATIVSGLIGALVLLIKSKSP